MTLYWKGVKMNKSLILLSAAALVAGCTSYHPQHTTRMYDNYGFTYDWSPSSEPVDVDLPARVPTPAPTYVVEVPPPTIIYQSREAALHSSADTNTPPTVSTSDDPNPYKGSYIIPPKVAVVPQQTILREAAVSATVISTNGVTVTNQPSAVAPSAIVDPAGAQVTNPAPSTLNGTNAAPPVAPSKQSPTTFQLKNTQSTSGSGTGQPAQSTTGGSFTPPPPGTTPLPGSLTAPRQ